MASEKETELLPCPFCGDHAETDFIPEHHSYAIECHSIGCAARVIKETAEDAVAAWNSRAKPAQVPAGWKMVFVNDAFYDLMYWLDRCADKGHLENCADLIEPYARFEYRSPPSTPEQSK